MSNLFIIRAGDLVVCVDASDPSPPHYLCSQVKDRLKKGAQYRVTKVVWLYGEKGLHLDGMDHRPTDGWHARRFRRLQKMESELGIGQEMAKASEAELRFEDAE